MFSQVFVCLPGVVPDPLGPDPSSMGPDPLPWDQNTPSPGLETPREGTWDQTGSDTIPTPEPQKWVVCILLNGFLVNIIVKFYFVILKRLYLTLFALKILSSKYASFLNARK